MSSARRNARNLLINGSSFAATGAVLFFLSPFVVHSLGLVEYGIWSLLNVVTGYMGLLDLGVRASTGRHIFLYIGRSDHAAVDETIRTSLGFFSVVGLLLLSVAALLGWGFPHAFSSVPAEYRPMLMWLVPLMAISVWTTTVAAILSSVLVAHERFDLARGVDLAAVAVRAVGTVAVLQLGYGLVGLALLTVATSLLPLVWNAWLGRQVYPQLRLWPLLFKGRRLRELGGFGLAAFISTASVRIVGRTDLIIVGGAIDVAAVTVYSVGATLIYYSQSLVAQIGNTFQPSLQKAVARNEMGPARWNFFRQMRLASLLGIPMYIGFIFYAEPFIRLWMFGPEFGESSVQAAATVMAVLAGAKLLNLFYIGSGPLLAALGHVRFNALISVGEAVLNLAFSLFFVLVWEWGLFGVAFGTLCSRLVAKTFLLPWYACRQAKISWTNYLSQFGIRGAAAAALFGGWCLVAQMLVPCRTWTMFATSVLLALVGFLPVAFLILMPVEDRNRVQGKLRLLWA